MKEKVQSMIYTQLFGAILFFVLGALLFTNPNGLVKTVFYIIGGVFCLLGIIKLFNYRKNKKNMIKDNNSLVYGIVMMIVGIVVILSSSTIELVLRVIMGSFILYSGINHLVINLKNEEKEGISSKNIITAILMILIGLYVILKTNLVFSGIGLMIMLYSILEIVDYVIYSQKKPQS